MKRILKMSVLTAVVFLLALALLSCSSGEKKMDEATFKDAVCITDENLTIHHLYNYDGTPGGEEIRVLDGTSYVNVGSTGEWFPYSAETWLSVFTEISESYSSFTVKDGKYTADVLTLDDPDGGVKTILNVELVFDGDNRLTDLYYEEENGAALYTFSYELCDYGVTVKP